MKIRMKSELMVIGKPTQSGKKDPTATYYFALVTQGEEDAGRIRVADVNVYNRIEKYKKQMFTFEYNEQYNSFAIVDVAPIEEKAPAPAPNTGNAQNAAGLPTAETVEKPNADKSPTTVGDKKH